MCSRRQGPQPGELATYCPTTVHRQPSPNWNVGVRILGAQVERSAVHCAVGMPRTSHVYRR